VIYYIAIFNDWESTFDECLKQCRPKFGIPKQAELIYDALQRQAAVVHDVKDSFDWKGKQAMMEFLKTDSEMIRLQSEMKQQELNKRKRNQEARLQEIIPSYYWEVDREQLPGPVSYDNIMQAAGQSDNLSWLLCGTTRVGKTLTAYQLLKYHVLADPDLEFCVERMSTLDGKITEAKNRMNDLDDLLDKILEYNIVMLDDFDKITFDQVHLKFLYDLLDKILVSDNSNVIGLLLTANMTGEEFIKRGTIKWESWTAPIIGRCKDICKDNNFLIRRE
jgi:DNA replication protein DnaC